MDRTQNAIFALIVNDAVLSSVPQVFDTTIEIAASTAPKSVSTPESKTVFMH